VKRVWPCAIAVEVANPGRSNKWNDMIARSYTNVDVVNEVFFCSADTRTSPMRREGAGDLELPLIL
jgi:hypothetical protein